MKPQTMLRTKLLAALITGGVAATLMLPTMVHAQSANANLRGTAPPNAEVTAHNVATGMTRVTRATAQGRYTLVGLPPGTWQVDAGPGTAQTVTLAVASTATLNLTPSSAAPAPATSAQTLQAVQVVGTPLLGVKISQVGEIVSQHQIETQPQVTRNFLEFADTVPGMIFTINPQGNTSLQSGAQNSSAVNVYIDGVSQKNYVTAGGVAGQFASQGNPFPQLAIGQYRVITSNYKAEYGQLSSAAVTAVTKTGTNQFHGEVYDNYTDSNYRDMTPAEKNVGEKAQSESREYGFALGGPIIKDRMHFFITDSQKRFDTPVAVTPGVTGVNDLLPPDAQAAFGPANLPFVENLFFGNVDWEITDSDRLLLRAQVRHETQDNNIGSQTAASAGIQVKNDVRHFDLEWDHTADAWYNKFLLSYQYAFYVPEGITSGLGQAFTFGPQNNALIIQTGAPDPRAAQNKGQKGPGFKDDLTFTDLNWLGDHTVQMGVRYQDLSLAAQDAGDATAQLFFNVCPLDSTTCPPGTGANPYKAVFASPATGLSPIVRSKDRQFGAYIQDDWAVNDHLTFNLGLRWDMERNPSYLDWVTPGNIVAAINSQDPNAPAGQTYAQSLALSGIDIKDFIANGHNRSARTNEWQPRLGFSYDINGDQKHVIFGGAGRAYDRNLYDYLQLEQTKIALGEFTYWFSSPGQPCLGQPCVPWDPAKFGSVAGLQTLASPIPGSGEVDMFTNDLKVPYSDQFSLGMRNQLGDWNTSLSLVRVTSHDGLAAWLGDRTPTGAFFVNNPQGNGGADFSNPVPGLGNLILWTNGIETRSTQLLLYANKPYTPESHWGMTIAYTHTNADHNRDITQHYSFDEPTIYDYPFIISNAAPKHRLVVTGVVDGPWGFTLSTKITLATPTPYNTNICFVQDGVNFTNGGHCLPAGGIPGGGKHFFIGGPIWGYRDIDFAAIKHIPITPTVDWYLRLDILNAFNYKNLVDLNFMSNAMFQNASATYNTIGNIQGVPRTFKFTMGVKW